MGRCNVVNIDKFVFKLSKLTELENYEYLGIKKNSKRN